MKLIVGLGNPGDKYKNSRHNLGFMVADALLKHFEPLSKTFWENISQPRTLAGRDKDAHAETKTIKIGTKTLFLAKPQSFMNNSGSSVSYLLQYYKIAPEELMVIYDDLDLPLGRIRVRFGGAAGGHKGVESIINAIKSDKFLRIRLGIGHPHKHDGNLRDGKSTLAVEDYVIANFTPGDKGKVKHMIHEAIRAVDLILEHGIEKYMSKYNGETQSGKVAELQS